MLQELPSPDFVSRVYATIPDSELANYALDSIAYILTADRDQKKGLDKKWPTDEIQQLFLKHGNFSHDYILMTRSLKEIDPRDASACVYHVHDQATVCPVHSKKRKTLEPTSFHETIKKLKILEEVASRV